MKKQDFKMVKLDVDIHKRLKEQSAKAGVSMKKYISLCLVQCKSEAGVNVIEKKRLETMDS